MVEVSGITVESPFPRFWFSIVSQLPMVSPHLSSMFWVKMSSTLQKTRGDRTELGDIGASTLVDPNKLQMPSTNTHIGVWFVSL